MTLHFRRPPQKSPKILALMPGEFPEFKKPNLLHFHAAVGLDSPQQKWTTPWGEAMAAGGIPEKSDYVAHGKFVIEQFVIE